MCRYWGQKKNDEKEFVWTNIETEAEFKIPVQFVQQEKSKFGNYSYLIFSNKNNVFQKGESVSDQDDYGIPRNVPTNDDIGEEFNYREEKEPAEYWYWPATKMP